MNVKQVTAVVKQARQNKFAVLQHPGNVSHIRRDPREQTRQIIYGSDSQAFTETFLILENMIVDHLPSSYEEVLNNLVAI